MKLRTNGKMKIAGYIIILCALIMTMFLFTGKAEVNTVSESLVKYWGGIGIMLLFGNAGKSILGGYAQGKTSNENK